MMCIVKHIVNRTVMFKYNFHINYIRHWTTDRKVYKVWNKSYWGDQIEDDER